MTKAMVRGMGNPSDLIFVISGPSGSGKGTIIELLIGKIGCRKAVSGTTRSPRKGEIDGRDYYFITRKRFDEMVGAGELAEYNYYSGNGYGTPKYEIENAVKNDIRLILDVDVHGAENIAKIYPSVRRVFIIPPCASEQRRRLEGRGTNSKASVDDRMRITRDELARWKEYDCIIVNEHGATERAANEMIGVMNGFIPDQSGIEELIEHYFDR